MVNNSYLIYTDGACSGNPGPGGWAAVIQMDGETREISGHEKETTNQRMELRAAIEALKTTPEGSRITLHSDSAYLVNCFKQNWMERWYKNGWRNARGEAVENRDLWEELFQLAESRKVEWIKVKGHGADILNKQVDQLARKALFNDPQPSCIEICERKKDELSRSEITAKRGGKSMRRLGLLTGGGDCPGLNAVIRAVVKGATYNHDLEVVGFNNGFRGLVENDAGLIDDLAVSGILNRGGTILGTSNRDNPFDYRPGGSDYRETGKDRSADAISNLKEWAVECLVVIGGDGSLFLAHRFSELGVPIIGIPKTIDNDLPATDVTFGFDSAVTTATEAIDKIHTTAESHHRVMVVEVMGRHAGWIALQAGMAGGGDIILIPELPFEYSHVINKIMERRTRGKKFSIIVVAEGAYPVGEEPVYQSSGDKKRLGGIGMIVSNEIEKRTGLESRATVLGHLQRGGSPTSYDRVLATRFGVKAVELFQVGKLNEMVCLKGNHIESVPLDVAVAGTKLVDPKSEQVRAAVAVGTSFGCPI
ncbi:MAG: ribonuclease HI [Bacillota bacterium]|nr:ribonuclease HI [Bacillota bacterium]